MATCATRLKIPKELKARVETAAEAIGQSPHAFMLDAIVDGTARIESRRGFVTRALAARARFAKSRMGYAADDVHRYMSRRAQGKKIKQPTLKHRPK